MKKLILLIIIISTCLNIHGQAQTDYFKKSVSEYGGLILVPSKCDKALDGKKIIEVIAYDDVMLKPTSTIFRSVFSQNRLKDLDLINKGLIDWYVDSETGEVLSVLYYLSDELYEFLTEKELIDLSEKYLSYKFDMSKVKVVKPGVKGYWQFSVHFGRLISGKRKRDR